MKIDIGRTRGWKAALVLAAWLAVCTSAPAQKRYDTGASDSTIRIGNTMPYSGPASIYGVIGKTIDAYFRKINAEGGIRGRQIEFISLDDGYSPPVAVEQTRKLVEQEKVLLIFAPLGTATSAAAQRYLNLKKVPQLFVSSGAERWGDDARYPWSLGWNPTYVAEGRIYAKHILATRPGAKIAVLYQNDDFGKDSLRGLLEGLGDKADSMVIARSTYEVSDPTVDSQLISLKNSGADTLVNLTTPKFAAQSIRKLAAIDWKPVHYLSNVSASVSAVLLPAGAENSKHIMTATPHRDPREAADSPEGRAYLAFMKQYYPKADASDTISVTGYSLAQTLVHVLNQAGDDLTRANIMKEAKNMDLELPMLRPGVKLKTGGGNHFPIARLQLVQFDGKRYQNVGAPMGS